MSTVDPLWKISAPAEPRPLRIVGLSVACVGSAVAQKGEVLEVDF